MIAKIYQRNKPALIREVARLRNAYFIRSRDPATTHLVLSIQRDDGTLITCSLTRPEWSELITLIQTAGHAAWPNGGEEADAWQPS